MKNLFEYLQNIFEADNSWGEIFESVICEAWNSQGKSLGKYEEFVAKKGLNPQEVCQNIYKCIIEANILSPGDELSKLNNVPETTSEWYELGMYTKKPNTTPKTDIISDKKGICKISVKEESGARLMSGAVNETIATMRAAVNNSGNKEVQDFVDEIVNELKDKKTRGRIVGTTKAILKKLSLRDDKEVAPEDESERVIWEIERSKERLAALIEHLKKFPDVYHALLKEAITGEVKFGKNNAACANYILTWNNKGECQIYTTDDYIDKFGKDYKIYATYKSSSVKLDGVKSNTRDSWMVMTLSN